MIRMTAWLGGVVAGVIGAAVWAAIAYFAEMEIGWIAWGIGGLVGFGVAYGNGRQGSTAAGVLAAVLAALSVAAGKYYTVQMYMPEIDLIAEESISRLDDEEYLISYLADSVGEAFAQQGVKVIWPELADEELPEDKEDYPKEVWTEAEAVWNGMSPNEREDYKAETAAMIESNFEAFRLEMSNEGFLGTFGFLDILFFGLAVVTAFQIAGRGMEEEVAQVATASPPLDSDGREGE
ncbi:MAG: hypothetical protein OEY63_07235 [Gemmatimonadota bacterium]|nr:hypothetical protein [Gemmatimonadota bacterium]MDH5804523.1 hypothetical protein [Gemmatimonadota bacterium]